MTDQQQPGQYPPPPQGQPPPPPGYEQQPGYQPPAYAAPPAAPYPGQPYAPGPNPDEGKTLQIIGYVMAGCALIIPVLGLVGLILGIIVATKPGRGGHGAAIIAISLVVGLASFFFWLGVNS